MVYYKKTDYKLLGYEKATRQGKMYNALLQRNKDQKIIRVPFGSSKYQNYRDKTGLDLYHNLIHGDKTRRDLYRKRHSKDLKVNHYSPGYFSYYVLW
jgi:hypothetical protein